MKLMIFFLSLLTLSLRAELENDNPTSSVETTGCSTQEDSAADDAWTTTTETFTDTFTDDFTFTTSTQDDVQNKLIASIVAGDRESLLLALDDGAQIDKPDAHGNLPLHIATYFGNPAIISALIAQGGDVYTALLCGCNTKELGKTHQKRIIDQPLHLALQQKNSHAAIKLIKQGADINTPDSEGFLPIQRAALNGDEHIIDLLLERGADINGKIKVLDPNTRSTTRNTETSTKTR